MQAHTKYVAPDGKVEVQDCTKYVAPDGKVSDGRGLRPSEPQPIRRTKKQLKAHALSCQHDTLTCMIFVYAYHWRRL